MQPREIVLSVAEASSAAAIQTAIDSLGPAGGRVILPAMELVLDRGLELRSNVELAGQGRGTLLRHAPGRIYPFNGYHNYGMMDVPLVSTEGLAPGMTVAIRDDRHGGFFETFARITWVEQDWAGIDCGLHSDYEAELNPILVTAFPLIYGIGIENAGASHLTLDGDRAHQPAGIGACRGAAVYFLHSRHLQVSDVVEYDFLGEGLGFQICSDVQIRNSTFSRNSGNGLHPGAGSTAALFDGCTADGNDRAGFFFCVRANHITVRDCAFHDNTACGISVGTRDSFNLIQRCRVENNAGPGILFRREDSPVEPQSIQVEACTIAGNARASGSGQIDIRGAAHHLAFVHNTIRGTAGAERAGIAAEPAVHDIWLEDNTFANCAPPVACGGDALTDHPFPISCGMDSAQPQDLRHLRSR